METTSLWLKFAGWFQCRLAADPDPADEPRGVQGYIHAAPGEPDFDRIIRFQPSTGIVQRSHCPPIGVEVICVWIDQRTVNNHPMVGGSVDFLDNPKFEGRNTILAEGGEEAVFPLHIRIKKDRSLVQRKFDDEMRFPPLNREDRSRFRNLQATGLNVSPGVIGEVTGIFDLANVWKERVAMLQSDLAKTTNETDTAAIKSRIELMSNMAGAFETSSSLCVL